MATIKRQKKDGNWEYLQLTGEDINHMKNDIDVHQSDYVKHQGFGITTGSDNNYLVTLSPSPNAYVDGMGIAMAVHIDSNDISTLNINGLGSKRLNRSDGSAVTDLKQNGVYTFRYNAATDAFILQGEGTKIHGNEFHAEPFMPISGGDFTGPITVNGKPLNSIDIDTRLEKVTYYVRSTGNDNNDGLSEDTAFKTFHKAVTTLKKINWGPREVNVGAGVSLIHDNIDYRTFEFKDYFGGSIKFDFNGEHSFAPNFNNIQANLEIFNFTRYDTPISGSHWGTWSGFINCMNVWVENAIVNRTGINSAYSGFVFSNSQGAVARSKFIDVSNYCVSAERLSYVRVGELKGNVLPGGTVYDSSGGSIIIIFTNEVQSEVRDSTSEGGQIFGN